MDRGSGSRLGGHVYEWILRSIENGTYRPGDRLREEEIAGRLKVSRTPVREALGRLQDKRFIDNSAGRSLAVRRLDIRDVVELYTMSEIVEGGAARLAADHASDLEVETIRAVGGEFAAVARTEVLPPESQERALVHLNLQFHLVIQRAAHNRYLDTALAEVREAVQLLGSGGFLFPNRVGQAAEEHLAIVEAISRRDPAGAEESARHHVRAALHAHLRLLRVG